MSHPVKLSDIEYVDIGNLKNSKLEAEVFEIQKIVGWVA
jgi:hypothetical protein